MRRRDFLAALAGAGALGLTRARGAMASPGGTGAARTAMGSPAASAAARSAMALPTAGRHPLRTLPDRWGVQLYTVRDRMSQDVPGTLRAVAEMGYGEVEFAGLFDHPPARMRALLDELGVRAASSHVGMNVIRGEWEAALDGAATLGQDTIVLPSLPGDARTADGLRALSEELNRAGEAARAKGLHLGFHNHDFEVRPLGAEAGGDGTAASRPLDLILAHTDPELVHIQLDLFWTVHGGADPLAYFRDHPGRFLSVHAKDRTAAGEMVAVGEGALDFAALLAAGEAAGVRHAFVEHDRPDDSLASIRASIAHLKELER